MNFNEFNEPAQSSNSRLRSGRVSKNRLSSIFERSHSKAQSFDGPVIVETAGGPTRHRVGKAGMNEFTLGANSTSRSSMSSVDYAPKKKRSSAKKTKVRRAKSNKLSMPLWKKALWGFFAFLILRLVFMQGGVIDFYKMRESIAGKEHELALLEQDNANIQNEIKKIKSDASYQKQLARENLGVIARDEFLVVFPRERVNPSI